MDRIAMAGHLIRRLHQQSTQAFQAGMQAIGVDMTSVQFAALDAIVQQTEDATNNIMTAAETQIRMKESRSFLGIRIFDIMSSPPVTHLYLLRGNRLLS